MFIDVSVNYGDWELIPSWLYLPDGLGGAALECFDAELDFRVCHGLTKDQSLAHVVISTEEIRRNAAAHVAVNAAAIDVETAWCILRESVFKVGHG